MIKRKDREKSRKERESRGRQVFSREVVSGLMSQAAEKLSTVSRFNADEIIVVAAMKLRAIIVAF